MRDGRATRRDLLPLLLVEDSPVNRKVALTMLGKLGYAVDVAQDGHEALEAVSRQQYAAVLMDLQMPNLDGYQAAQRVRDQEAGHGGRLPIIAMTTGALTGEREKALAVDMDDSVPKPFRMADLAAVLTRWARSVA